MRHEDDPRPSFDETYMMIASVVAERATCDRAHVGCVITIDDRIVATGYNGSPPGYAHCDDEGHLLEGNHCVRTLHAEANAIANAAIRNLRGATAYLTHSPCLKCANLLVAEGFGRVVVGKRYGATYHQAKEALLAAGVEVDESYAEEDPDAPVDADNSPEEAYQIAELFGLTGDGPTDQTNLSLLEDVARQWPGVVVVEPDDRDCFCAVGKSLEGFAAVIQDMINEGAFYGYTIIQTEIEGGDGDDYEAHNAEAIEFFTSQNIWADYGAEGTIILRGRSAPLEDALADYERWVQTEDEA